MKRRRRPAQKPPAPLAAERDFLRRAVERQVLQNSPRTPPRRAEPLQLPSDALPLGPPPPGSAEKLAAVRRRIQETEKQQHAAIDHGAALLARADVGELPVPHARELLLQNRGWLDQLDSDCDALRASGREIQAGILQARRRSAARAAAERAEKIFTKLFPPEPSDQQLPGYRPAEGERRLPAPPPAQRSQSELLADKILERQ